MLDAPEWDGWDMSESDNEKIDFSGHKIEEDQVCVLNVPVGKLDTEQASNYLKAVAHSFKEETERAGVSKVAFFVFPKNRDGTTTDLSVFTPKDGEHYIIQAPVDGLPAKERVMYLKMLKEQLKEEWPNKKCTISVLPVGATVKVQGGTPGFLRPLDSVNKDASTRLSSPWSPF